MKKKLFNINAHPLQVLVVGLGLAVFFGMSALAFFESISPSEGKKFAISDDVYNIYAHDYSFKANVYGEEATPNMENNPTPEGSPTPFCVWGDTFCLSKNSRTPSTSAFISKYTGRIIYSVSNESDTLKMIAARQGGMPMLVTPCDIPAKKETIEITLSNELGEDIQPNLSKNGGLNPCSINGIGGMITEYDGKYYFTRDASGFEELVLKPTPVTTRAMSLRRDDIQIIFVGNANNLYPEPEKNIEVINKMVDYTTSKDYIVVGPVIGDDEAVTQINSAYEKAFGDHFVNLKEFLLNENIYKEYGLSLKEADLSVLRSGKFPETFFDAQNYFNIYIADLSGYCISQKAVDLGYAEPFRQTDE